MHNDGRLLRRNWQHLKKNTQATDKGHLQPIGPTAGDNERHMMTHDDADRPTANAEAPFVPARHAKPSMPQAQTDQPSRSVRIKKQPAKLKDCVCTVDHDQ